MGGWFVWLAAVALAAWALVGAPTKAWLVGVAAWIIASRLWIARAPDYQWSYLRRPIGGPEARRRLVLVFGGVGLCMAAAIWREHTWAAAGLAGAGAIASLWALAHPAAKTQAGRRA